MNHRLLSCFALVAFTCITTDTRAESPAAAAPAAPLALAIAQRTALEIGGPYVLGVGQPEKANQPRSVMLREERAIDLKPGKSTIEWTDLPDSMIAETTSVILAEANRAVRIVGVHFAEPQMTQAALEAALRGVPLTAVTERQEQWSRRTNGEPPANARMTRTTHGTLVSLAGGVVLDVGHEFTVLPSSSIRIDSAPPRRRLLVDVDVAAGSAPVRAAFELTSVLQNVTMHVPHYTLRINELTRRASLFGSMLISNMSGYALGNARVFYMGSIVVPPGGSYRFRAEESTGVASTWAMALTAKAPQPFELPTLLGAGSKGVTDAPVAAEVNMPLSASNYVRVTSRSALAERQEAPEVLPIVRVFELDTSGRSSVAPFPSGPTVVLSSPGEGPALPVAEGYFDQRDAKSGRVVALTSAWDLRVAATQLSTRRTGKCTVVTSIRYAIPRQVLEVAPFELQVPFSRKEMTVTLAADAAKDGVSLRSTPSESVVTIAKRSQPPNAPKPGPADSYLLRVEYKLNECPR